MIPFSESGFLVLKKFFRPSALHRFEARVLALYEDNAFRLGLIDRHVSAEVPEPPSRLAWLSAILEAMEANHKAEAYQVQKIIENDVELMWLFDETFFSVSGHMLAIDGGEDLGDEPKDLKVQSLCLFINRPRTTRLLAKWHSERHYYPELKRFLNCHFPLFCDKTKDNGAMSVIPGSHQVKWTFDGYSPGENAIYQKEISEEQLSGYHSVVVEEKRGDACFFHANLVHKSNENLSDKYSFAMVCRVVAP